MRRLIFILLIFTPASIFSQTSDDTFISIQEVIQKAHSNISSEALYVIKGATKEQYILIIESGIDNTIEKNTETFELDFNLFEDSYTLPTAEGYKVITMFKEPVLIKTAKVDYENAFHKELYVEDFKETNEIWFNFPVESDAVEFEKLLFQIKKSLNSN